MVGEAWAQAGQTPAQPSLLVNLVPFILIFAVFYFLLIRPQMRRQRVHEEMVRNLGKGDRVVTQGGLIGVIVGTKDDVAVLKIAENTKIEVLKGSITAVRGKSQDG